MHAIPDFAYSWRPYAARDMLFKPVVDRSGRDRVFVIDPGTQRWAVLGDAETSVLRQADGKTRFSAIIRTQHLAEEALTPENLARGLVEVGLLYDGPLAHAAASRNVYNSCEPIGMHLEITNACNMTCTHCYVASGTKLPNEMSDDDLRRAIDMVPPFSGKRIAISGGEPIVRRGCIDIVEYAAITCGHDVDLYTNGRRFPRRFAERIASLNAMGLGQIRIQLSLEGAIAATHDLVRGAGAFDDAIESLRMLKDVGLSQQTILFVCLTKANIDDVDDLIALAESYDVGMLVFSQWQRQGNAAATPWASIAPSTERWVAVGEHLLTYTNARLRVFGNFYGDLTNGGPLCLDAPLFPKHVYYYNAFPRVTPQGDILADQLWVDPGWVLGNVISGDTFESCFRKGKFHDQLDSMRLRSSQIEACRSCEWRPLCEGGSAGHTYAEYGHMNERDLFCESRKYWFTRYVDHQLAAM